MADTNNLRKLASAATPGPWHVSPMYAEKEPGYDRNIKIGGLNFSASIHGNDHHSFADANYIAAVNPSAILALLDEHEAALAASEARNEAAVLEQIKLLVAQMFCASGCSCCRDDTEWYRTTGELAKLLGVPAFYDGSGFDFYAVKNSALIEKEPKP